VGKANEPTHRSVAVEGSRRVYPKSLPSVSPQTGTKKDAIPQEVGMEAETPSLGQKSSWG